jgi:hypothetical protein
MMKKLSLPFALLAAAAFAATPVQAQHGNGHGKGHGNEHGNGQSEVRRNRDDDRDDDRDEARAEARRREWRRTHNTRTTSGRTTLNRRVPPGWCIGRGNPHNTVANCGPGRNRYERRYDPRYQTTRSGTRTNRSTSGYATFSEWKRVHDRQCREQAMQRPLDLSWQRQVHAQCVAEERNARLQYGV